MDLDNVAEDDVIALNEMGFSPKWNRYALSYFHGSRDQAVQFLLEHNERLIKISEASNKVTIDDIIALGFSAVDITTAMVENNMNMEKSVQFLLLRKHLLSADSLAFSSPPAGSSGTDPSGRHTETPHGQSTPDRMSATMRPRRASNSPLPAVIPMPKSDSQRGSLLPPKTSRYPGREFPIRFDLPVEVDPDVFFCHTEDVQLEQQALYSMDLAQRQRDAAAERDSMLPSSVAFADDAPEFNSKSLMRTYWVHEYVVQRHPTLRLGIQLRGPPDWHLVVVELKSGPNREPGPAEVAGIQVGDILLAVNSHQIRGLQDLSYLTTVTKKSNDSLLRIARAEDPSVRSQLVAQATMNSPSAPSVAEVAARNRQSAALAEADAAHAGASNSDATPVSEGQSALAKATAASQERARIEAEQREAEETKNAQQRRDFLVWLRKLSPPPPTTWKACFVAMSSEQQKKLYEMKSDRQRKRHMAIAAGFHEFVVMRSRQTRWRGNSPPTTGPEQAAAQLEAVLQPVYKTDGIRYLERTHNLSRAAAEEYYAEHGHPFSGAFCLEDAGEAPSIATPRNVTTNSTDKAAAAGNPLLELPDSLKSMLVDMHALTLNNDDRSAVTDEGAGRSDGDWKSKFGNFFKKMGAPNKKAEYTARLKTYAAMLHDYDSLLRKVHEEVQSRYGYLYSVGQDFCSKVRGLFDIDFRCLLHGASLFGACCLPCTGMATTPGLAAQLAITTRILA